MEMSFSVLEDLSHFTLLMPWLYVVRLPGVFVQKRAGNVDQIVGLNNKGVHT